MLSPAVLVAPLQPSENPEHAPDTPPAWARVVTLAAR